VSEKWRDRMEIGGWLGYYMLTLAGALWFFTEDFARSAACFGYALIVRPRVAPSSHTPEVSP
jgi:hypothetical protein